MCVLDITGMQDLCKIYFQYSQQLISTYEKKRYWYEYIWQKERKNMQNLNFAYCY